MDGLGLLMVYVSVGYHTHSVNIQNLHASADSLMSAAWGWYVETPIKWTYNDLTSEYLWETDVNFMIWTSNMI